jgi:hypothetical protein
MKITGASLNIYCSFLFFSIGCYLIFQSFPEGWDQAEYCWSIKSSFLPHSPYILYFLIGRLMLLVGIDPSLGLSILAFSCGCGMLLIFNRWIKIYLPNATLALPILASSYLFIRFSSFQEIYVVQLFLVWTTILLNIKNPYWGGVSYGFSLSLHNSSIFFLPLLTYVNLKNNKFIFKWFLGFIPTIIIFIAILLYYYSFSDYFSTTNFFKYLRGIAPSINPKHFNPLFILSSISVFFINIINNNFGISVFYFILIPIGIIGLIKSSSSYKWFVFWYVIPYISYEILLGWNLDIGIYLVFLIPILSILVASGIEFIAEYLNLNDKFFYRVIAVILVSYTSWKLIVNEATNFSTVKKDHFNSVANLKEGLAVNSSDKYIVVDTKYLNINLFGYYSGLKPFLFEDNKFWVSLSETLYTPLNKLHLTEVTPSIIKVIRQKKQRIVVLNPVNIFNHPTFKQFKPSCLYGNPTSTFCRL